MIIQYNKIKGSFYEKILILFILLFSLTLTNCSIKDNIKSLDYPINKAFCLKNAFYIKNFEELKEKDFNSLPFNKKTIIQFSETSLENFSISFYIEDNLNNNLILNISNTNIEKISRQFILTS